MFKTYFSGRNKIWAGLPRRGYGSEQTWLRNLALYFFSSFRC